MVRRGMSRRLSISLHPDVGRDVTDLARGFQVTEAEIIRESLRLALPEIRREFERERATATDAVGAK